MFNLLSYLEERRIISEIVWAKRANSALELLPTLSLSRSLSLPHTQSLIGANCQNNPTGLPSSGDILNSPAVLLIRIRQTGTRLRVIAPSRAIMPPSFPPHTHIKSFCCCIHSDGKVPRRGAPRPSGQDDGELIDPPPSIPVFPNHTSLVFCRSATAEAPFCLPFRPRQ